MPVHQLGEFKHGDLRLTAEERLELVIGVDVAPVLSVLVVVLTDVVPYPFGDLGPGQRLRADHRGQCFVGLHGFGQGADFPLGYPALAKAALS